MASQRTRTASRSTLACAPPIALWAVGDVTGVRLLTHVGKYQGEVVASNILGEAREANYEAIPDVVYTDPQAASVGATERQFSATATLSEVAKTATYTRAYAQSNGFLTLLSDGTQLTGAYALGPEAGEWLQQATLAIRARVPLAVLRDTIQPFPTFSEIYVRRLDKALASRSFPPAGQPQRHSPRPAPGPHGHERAGRGCRYHRRVSGHRRPPGRRVPRGRLVGGRERNAMDPSPDPEVLSVAGDLADPATGQLIIDAALGRFGRIADALINNAGVFMSKPFTDYTAEDYTLVVGVNVTGFFRLTQRAIAEMLKAGGGHVVNITTTIVDHAHSSEPSALVSLTKGGVAAATRSLAVEYATRGIRVNAVAPGVIQTADAPGEASPGTR